MRLCKSVKKQKEKRDDFKGNAEKTAKTTFIKKNRNISLVEKVKIMYTQTVMQHIPGRGNTMPKLIENLKEKLLAEAKKQLTEVGYEAMMISSLAKACGVGVGTVYNYFPSKEAILHACISEDWEKSMAVIENVAKYSLSYEPVIHCVYDQIVIFAREHRYVFRESVTSDNVYAIIMRHTKMLNDRVSVVLRKFCSSDAQAQLIAEAMVTWICTGKSYEDICRGVSRMF